MISDFRREVVQNCAVLGHYAASSGKFLPTFRSNLSVPILKVQEAKRINIKLRIAATGYKMGLIVYPETSPRNYWYWLLNNAEDRNS